MGILFTYFSAPTDDLAASTITRLGGPGTAADSGGAFAVVEDAGFDPVVQCGTLEAILTGRTYEDVEGSPGWGRLLAQQDGGERLVVGLTEPLASALASSTVEDLRMAAGHWAQTEEFFGQGDPEVLGQLLDDLSTLARNARETGDRLYCWVCV